MPFPPFHQLLCFAFGLGLLVSGVYADDRLTWALEVAPALVLLPLLLWFHRRAPLSDLLWLMLAVQGGGLLLGAHYGYANVPFGDWLQDRWHLSRNPFDRIGHFIQGITPALFAREWLMGRHHVHGPRLLAFLGVSVAMMLSAFYELVEWRAAIWLGEDADAFLGTQGDPWDTQADMGCALLGALLAMTLLVPLQDRALAKLSRRARWKTTRQPLRTIPSGRVSNDHSHSGETDMTDPQKPDTSRSREPVLDVNGKPVEPVRKAIERDDATDTVDNVLTPTDIRTQEQNAETLERKTRQVERKLDR